MVHLPFIGLFGMGIALVGILPLKAAESLHLWPPGAAPLAVVSDKPEGYLPLEPGQDPDITRLANVAEPTLSVYSPPPERRTKTAVLILPGGGYHILAMRHEGTQVAEWLNSLGVTAAVLKYRVPAPPGEPAQLRPLLDAQRALVLLRSRASDLGLDPGRIGVLGFSAGGHLAACVLCQGNRRGQGYPDAAGEPSCRPDFGILIYPAYLAASEPGRERPSIVADQKPGPVFFVHAADDPLGPENSLEFFLALRRAGVPGELHVYQQGGHGFGMLRQGRPVNDWPTRCAEWMQAQGWLERP